MAPRASTADKPVSLPALRKLERGLAQLEQRANNHDEKDDTRFGVLTAAITQVGTDLTHKIDTTFGELQTQVLALKEGKVRAEGFAAGMAQSKIPNPWVLAIVPGLLIAVVGALLGFIGAWAARDQIQGGLGGIRSQSTTTTIEQPLHPRGNAR